MKVHAKHFVTSLVTIVTLCVLAGCPTPGQPAKRPPPTPTPGPSITAPVYDADSLSANKDAIIAQLAADPEWQVTIDRQIGELVAYMRELKRGEWVPSAGMGAWPGSCMTRIHFGGGVSDASFYSSGETKAIGLYKVVNFYRSQALIGAPGCWVLVSEQQNTPTRFRTQQELDAVIVDLNEISKCASEIRERGSCAQLLAGRLTTKSSASLSISTESHPGLVCWGWVNPGEPGMTSIRLFDHESGSPLSPHMHSTDTERVGWSTDSTALFYFRSDLVVPNLRTGFNSTRRVRAELWFDPDGDGEPRQLLVAEQSVRGWER